MRPEIRDAIESARTADGPLVHGARRAEPMRHISFARLRNYLHQFVRELPEDITISDLRDELDNASNQDSRG